MTSTTNPFHNRKLHSLSQHIHKQIGHLPSLRKITPQRRNCFAVNLALIGLCFRTGYLVDVVAPSNPEPVFAQLISGLRATCPEFNSVAHVYEPISEQSFFINIPMLLDRHSCMDGGSTYGVSFVHLGPGSSFSLLPGPPPDLVLALDSLVKDTATHTTTTLPPSITLSSGLSRQYAIPLAATLLEYPVAYVPTTLESPFLSNVTLDIHECVLSSDETGPHTLLKFSCPSELALQHLGILGRPHIAESLSDKYAPRIRAIAPSASFEILQSTQTLDRVAL